MRRLRRVIAGFLCMVILTGAIPVPVFAEGTANQIQNAVLPEGDSAASAGTETDSVPASETAEQPHDQESESQTNAEEAAASDTEAQPADEDSGAEDTNSQSNNQISGASDADSQLDDQSSEASGTESESVVGDADASKDPGTTDDTQGEDSESQAEGLMPETEAGEGAPRWLYSLNEDGFAVIEGYTDTDAAELSVPYTLDGHYVAAIGEKAFSENKNLARIYIHGNVQSIAGDAFDGLAPTLIGYNGTTVMKYASERGYDFRLRSDQDYFSFTDKVIDFSYAEEGRYQHIDASTIQMALPEALQLETGDLFYLPEAYDNLVRVYEVLSVSIENDYARITVREADYADAVTSVSIQDDQLYADWSQAEWEDGVVISEEKLSGSVSGQKQISLTYTHELGKQNISSTSIDKLTGKEDSKILGTANAELFVEGSLSLKGTATVDIDLIPAEVNDLSLILTPSVQVKGGIRFSANNTAANTFTRVEMVKPQDYTFEIGSVPLISASGVVTVKVAVYLKVSASGEITITFSGQGDMGFRWNDSKNELEGVNKWKWDTPSVDGSIKLEIGPSAAVELHCAVLGKVVSLEVFLGGILNVKVKGNLGAGGSTDLESGQTATTVPGVCADVDLDLKLSLTIALQLELLKDILNARASWELFSLTKDMIDTHWEARENFIGFLDKCTYETTFLVQFCTFTSETIEPVESMFNASIQDPGISDLPDNQFLGWYKDPNYTEKWDFDNDKVTADMTLYARWERSVKTVAFVTQNEEVGAADWTMQFVPGSMITEPGAKIMNWKNNGWFLDEGLTDQWDFTKDVMPDHDLTLYGSWTYDETYDPFIDVGSDKNYTISDGLLYYNGHVYEHVASYQLFSAARADAESQGGYLVTISSQEEMDAVLDYVQGDCAQRTLWLGINSTTDWKYWLNGEKMIYWNGSDPETSGSQYNGIFYRSDGEWGTYDNGNTSHYIIEWGDYKVDPGFSEYMSASPDGSVQYNVSDDGESVSVVGFSDGEEVNISNIYEGTLVKEIESYAFQNNTTVRSISIPSTVETIGEYAFAGCTSLEEIVIPESVTSIGENAFRGCTSLKKVVLPNGLEVLPEYTFYNCTALTEILNMENLTEIGNRAFYGCTALVKFEAPRNLKRIGDSAFYGCTALETLVLNSELTEIGANAFGGCSKLSGTITFSDRCSSIGTSAFSGCVSLEHVFLQCGKDAIGNSAFEGVSAVFHGKTVDGIDVWCEENGKEYLNADGTFRISFFTGLAKDASEDGNGQEGTSPEDLYLAAGSRIEEPSVSRDGYVLEGWYTDPKYVQKWDFARDRTGNSDITLYAHWVEDASVFSYYVESGNAYLTDYSGADDEVEIPESLGGYPVIGICKDTFSGKDSVKKVSIPSTVSYIEANAFESCINLYTIAFPEGNDSFLFINGVLYSADRKDLIYVAEGRTFAKFIVPDGTERIFAGAMKNQSGLSSVEIPASVKEIGEEAFPISVFLTIYGPDADCAAKTYAEDYSISYNEYVVSFYDRNELLFSSVISTGDLLTEYTDLVSEYATYGGWYRDAECTDAWNFETDTMPAGNLSLYLKWNSDFAVREDADHIVITGYVGNSSTIKIPDEINGFPVQGIDDGAFVSSTEAPILSIQIPDSVTEISGKAIIGEPSPVIVADAGTTAESYANSVGLTFEKKSYYISFDVSGGVEIAPMAYTPGETPELPVPVKSNAHFLGWYTSAFYTELWDPTDVMPEQDITLYARWEVINSQITTDFSYEITEEGNAVITGYYGSKTVLSLPETINGYTVTAIGDYAFADNETVLSLDIPESVKSLGNSAFEGSRVMTITGGENVVSLGESCFSGASALKTPFLPEGVDEISGYCFEYCSAFTDVRIPDHISVIGDYAFYGCDFLRYVEIPESVTQIGSGAFAGCKNLQNVEIPSTLSGYGGEIFGNAAVNCYPAADIRIFSVRQLTKASVHIRWNEVDGADGYRLYRKQGTAGSWSLIKTVTDTETSNYSLTSGLTYYYKVTAVSESGSETVVLAESDEFMIRVARLSTPSVNEVQAVSNDSAVMSWSQVVGAEGYEIWRSYSADGEYSYLKTVAEEETLNTGLVGGLSYYYMVRAYYQEDDTLEYSAFSDPYAFRMPLSYMEIPENVTVRQTAAGTVLVSWAAVEGADGYNLYRRQGDGSLVFVKNTLSTSAYNYNLTEGETYEYAVEAYCSTDREDIVGQKSETVSVTIASLATPSIKSVSQSAVSTALISWTNISAADGYELWRSRTEDGVYSRMKSVTGTATSNYNLSAGVTYYYKVRAYVETADGEYEYGAYSAPVPITILSVAKTRLKSVVQADAASAKVTWAYMSGADFYEVWRSVNDNQHYELIRTTSGTAIQDRNLVDGQTYYYKVRAYDSSGEELVYGEFSDELDVCMIGSPVMVVAEQSGSSSVFLSWDQVESADGYELWRSTDGTDFSVVKSVVSNATYNYSLSAGETYYYKVRAYRTVGDGRQYGCFSNVMAAKIFGTPDVVSLLQNGRDGVKLSWSGDAYAEGYELWRSLSEDQGIYTKVKDVSGTSTTSFGLYETIASYKVRSYAMVGGNRVYGPFGDPMSIRILGTPVFKEGIQASTSAAYLSWDKVEGASAYKLYRSSSPDSGYSLLKTVDGTETTTYSLKSGNTYYFKLKAVTTENGELHESAYSDATAVFVSDLMAPYLKSWEQNGSEMVFTATINGNADGIELWRANESGEYQCIAESTDRTISDAAYDENQVFTYRIRSYRVSEDGRVYSAFSNEVGLGTLERPVINRAAQTDANTVYLAWTPVDGADYYEVSRSAGDSEEYTVLGVYTDTFALDKIEEQGSYQYRVRACVIKGNGVNYSVWTDGVSVETALYSDDVYPETEHEYLNDQNQIYTYTREGAEALRLTFSEASGTEADDDFIYIFDGEGNCAAVLSGSIGSTSIVTSGDTVQLYFTTDGSGTDYGFSFESITATSLEEVSEPQYHWGIAGSRIYTDGSTIFYDILNRNVFSHLTEIEVTEGTTEVPEYFMSGITSIEKVLLPEGLFVIGGNSFTGCTGITEISVPDSVTEIGDYAFYNCVKLENFDFPENLVSIGWSAFRFCKALDSILLPEGLETIGRSAFSECVSVRSLDLPETLTAIETGAFQDCTALTRVYFPAEIQSASIDYTASAGIFSGCTSLSEISFEEGTDTIQDGLFAGTSIQEIIIPETVTEIGVHAFSNCSELKSVVLPEGLVSIRNYAFYNCGQIRELSIPETVMDIGAGVFENCVMLSSVYIPAALQSANLSYHVSSHRGEGIFNGCTRLKHVTFGDGITYIPEGLFAGCGIEEIVLPDSVTGIGAYAFSGCEALTSVSLPANLTAVEESGFSYCDGLQNLSLPEKTSKIGAYAFYHCSDLKEIVMEGDALTEIGAYGFAYNTALESFALPEGIVTIEEYTFYHCSSLKEIRIDAVTSIGERAFSGCSSLTLLILPECLASISLMAFENCTGLTELTVPSSFGEITLAYSSGLGVFDGCTALTDIIFEEGITKIPNGAFAGSGIREIEIPETVTEIGEYAFSNCETLRNIQLPENLEIIGDRAFQNCSILKRLSLPSALTYLGSYAFQYCYDLTDVEIPAGIGTIQSYTFRNCTSLQTVKIAESVTAINAYAFSGCNSLKKISVPETVTSIAENAFRDVICESAGPAGGGYDYEFAWKDAIPENAFRDIASITSVVIPEGITSIGRYAFSRSGVKKIELPDSVTEADEYCFYDCDNLTDVIWSSSASTIPYRCFYSCSSLAHITIPEGVISIGSYAFRDTGLESLILPETVTEVSEYSFYNCDSLTHVTWSSSAEVIPDYCFEDSESLTDINIPEGVTTIGSRAFDSCISLKNVTMPESVKYFDSAAFGDTAITSAGPADGEFDFRYLWKDAIPDNAFRGMDSLISVVLPEGITSIGENAFYDTGILSITIPETISAVGESCFYNCDSLETVIWSANASAIPYRCFYDCDALKSISVSGNVATVDDRAFYGCDMLSDIIMYAVPATIGTNVFNGTAITSAGPLGGDFDFQFAWTETIPDNAFRSMNTLVEVEIPDGIHSIGSYAFYNTGLTSVVLPETVTEVSEYCFSNCYSLSEVVWSANATIISGSCFRNCSSLISFTVPEGITSIENRAFSGCGQLASVTIPDTVASIGSNVFSGCDSSLILYCTADSYAASYADENGYTHQQIS